MATEPPPSPEVIEMMSAHPRPSVVRPGTDRAAHRRALLALPVAALLVSAGCASGSNDQAFDQATGVEQQTVTATVTAPTGSTPTENTPTENTQTGNAPATDGFDPANCDTDQTGQDITGDVVVRSGQTCLLSDLTVNGDLDVHHDGRLELRGVRVAEDVEAEGHAFVLVSGGEVSGSIELDKGGEAVVENVRIGGSLESEQNSGPQRFEGNTIGGDLECEDNAHVPTGGGNQVAGEREGQCAAL
ncbi:hypothetical protein [uncultured Dietzia sp.]|uniref:hypothetical protein n=1 Tax=uncultured Dietzia sp. TaxID=395519 RepID=UPI0025F29D43|nr:hypothetical protein [uncultured Dietzia sp.]